MKTKEDRLTSAEAGQTQPVDSKRFGIIAIFRSSPICNWTGACICEFYHTLYGQCIHLDL